MAGFASVPHLRSLAAAASSDSNEFSQYIDPSTMEFLVNPGIQITTNGGPITNLSIGYTLGRNDSGDQRFGPEVGFGWTLQKYFHNNDNKTTTAAQQQHHQPLLIIKEALGGTSLGYSWRPPSAPDTFPGGTPVSSGAGPQFISLLRHIWTAIRSMDAQTVPGYSQRDGFEIAGFVWFQGWFDAFQEDYRNEYLDNLSSFIRDIRNFVNVPDLPFLIGELGQHGPSPTNVTAVEAFRDIQRAVADRFNGTNVVVVPTSPYVVADGERFDGIHHYYGRADTMIRIGNAFGHAVLKLVVESDDPATTVPAPSPQPVAPAPSRSPSISIPHVADTRQPINKQHLPPIAAGAAPVVPSADKAPVAIPPPINVPSGGATTIPTKATKATTLEPTYPQLFNFRLPTLVPSPSGSGVPSTKTSSDSTLPSITPTTTTPSSAAPVRLRAKEPSDY